MTLKEKRKNFIEQFYITTTTLFSETQNHGNNPALIILALRAMDLLGPHWEHKFSMVKQQVS